MIIVFALMHSVCPGRRKERIVLDESREIMTGRQLKV